MARFHGAAAPCSRIIRDLHNHNILCPTNKALKITRLFGWLLHFKFHEHIMRKRPASSGLIHLSPYISRIVVAWELRRRPPRWWVSIINISYTALNIQEWPWRAEALVYWARWETWSLFVAEMLASVDIDLFPQGATAPTALRKFLWTNTIFLSSWLGMPRAVIHPCGFLHVMASVNLYSITNIYWDYWDIVDAVFQVPEAQLQIAFCHWYYFSSNGHKKQG